MHGYNLTVSQSAVHLEDVVYVAIGQNEPQVLVLEDACAVLHHRACLPTEDQRIDGLLVLREHIACQLEVADMRANLHEASRLVAQRHETLIAFCDELEARTAIESEAVQNDLPETEVIGIDIEERPHGIVSQTSAEEVILAEIALVVEEHIERHNKRHTGIDKR